MHVGFVEMRIAAVSIVKDEADVIEAFVRHNLVFIDRMFIIDDRSTDNTTEILRRLALENPAVTVLDDGWNGAFHQSKRTTAALNLVRKMEDWDCVVALDADEFICTDARSTFETEIRAIPPAAAGGFRAIHYCIYPMDDASIRDPLARIRHATPVSSGVFKSFATGELLKIEGLAFSEGNHVMVVDGVRVERTWPLPSVTLAHFPIRSMDQIVVKLLKHYVAWLSRADYQPIQNHTTIAATLALKSEPTFALDQKSKILPLYLAFAPEYADLGERPFHERQGVLKWPDLAVSPPYAPLLGLFEGLIDRMSVLDHLSMFSGERDQVAALKRLVEDNKRLRDELYTLKHSRTAAGKNYLGTISARLRRSWRKRFRP
jgi:glycosyltransferase involved in cell wall biosynthesis